MRLQTKCFTWPNQCFTEYLITPHILLYKYTHDKAWHNIIEAKQCFPCVEPYVAYHHDYKNHYETLNPFIGAFSICALVHTCETLLDVAQELVI